MSKDLFLEMRMSYIDELFSADPEKIHQIESLLRTAIITPFESSEIEREILGYMEDKRADELLEYLYNNQVDPIQSGHNYSQTDIINKLKREI